MARDDGVDTVWVHGGPLVEKCIGFVAATWVIGGSGGVPEAQSLHTRPKTAHEEFGDGCPKSETAGVGLVAEGMGDVGNFVNLIFPTSRDFLLIPILFQLLSEHPCG